MAAFLRSLAGMQRLTNFSSNTFPSPPKRGVDIPGISPGLCQPIKPQEGLLEALTLELQATSHFISSIYVSEVKTRRSEAANFSVDALMTTARSTGTSPRECDPFTF